MLYYGVFKAMESSPSWGKKDIMMEIGGYEAPFVTMKLIRELYGACPGNWKLVKVAPEKTLGKKDEPEEIANPKMGDNRDWEGWEE